MEVQVTSYDQNGLIKRLQWTETNYYIMSLDMTFTLNDIHDIYNRDQISKKDHDSHQQLSYTMYDLLHKHLSTTSRPATYICPYQCKYHQPVTKYVCI